MISVLLPTRGRKSQLTYSVDTLMSNAADPDQVEILCAIDPDDEDTALRCKTLAEFYAPSFTAWTAPERFGYQRIHEYYNFLASEATGEWLMLWNDDAVMETKGWDTIVGQSCAGVVKNKVLFMDAIYPCLGQRGNILPIWPRAWYQSLGYVSRSPNVDVWISELGRRLRVEERIPVRAVHTRVEDDTTAAGRLVMGEGNGTGYDSLENRLERARAVKLLGQGQDFAVL
jgi:hypothetical protein